MAQPAKRYNLELMDKEVLLNTVKNEILVNQQTLDRPLLTTKEIDEYVHLITSILQKGIQISTPLKKPRLFKPKPYWDNELREARRNVCLCYRECLHNSLANFGNKKE